MENEVKHDFEKKKNMNICLEKIASILRRILDEMKRGTILAEQMLVHFCD